MICFFAIRDLEFAKSDITADVKPEEPVEVKNIDTSPDSENEVSDTGGAGDEGLPVTINMVIAAVGRISK